MSLRCATCGKPLGHDRKHILNREFCDVVCYAAAKTLSPRALLVWRANAWKLDINPMRPS